MKLGFRFRKKGGKPSKRVIQYIVGMLIMLLAAIAFSQEHLRSALFMQKPHDFSDLGKEALELASSDEKPYVAKARRATGGGGAPTVDQGSFFTAPLEYQPEEPAPAPVTHKVIAPQETYTPIVLPSQQWNIPPDDYSPSSSVPPVYNRVQPVVTMLSGGSLGGYVIGGSSGSNSSGSDGSESGGSDSEDTSGSDGSGSDNLGGGSLGGGELGDSGSGGNIPIPPAVYLLGVGFAVVARRMRGCR